MNRTIKMDLGRITTREQETVIRLSQGETVTLALEVTLLLHGLVDDLHCVSGVFGIALKVYPERFTTNAFVHESDGSVQCLLSRNSAEYLQATLLRAYRDGMAEVDHIHLEGEKDGCSFDLTFFFDASRPPMTPEEAAKLMDE